MNSPRVEKARWADGWKVLLVWAIAAGAMAWLDNQVDLANLAMVLVLASAVSSLWLPAAVSMGLSALGVLVFNVAFIPPRGTFHVDVQRHLLLLGVMLVVSWIVAVLMARLRQAAEAARVHADRADQLRALGDALRDADEPRHEAGRLREALQALTGGPVQLLVLNAPAPAVNDRAAETWLGEPNDDVRTGAWACLRQQAAFGPGTGQYEELSAWYLPLRGRGGHFGAAWLDLSHLSRRDTALRAHAQSLCDQMGQALSRAHALAAAREARTQAHDQGVRNALLAAISHDFRTPLATIMGAGSSLQEQDARLSIEQRRKLATTIVDEAQHLSRMTDNALQLARLDAPGVRLSLDWESAEELVGTVLRHARQRHPQRQVRARLEPGLPLLRCDALLLTQLLDNLVDNALKYSEPTTFVEVLVRRQQDQVVLSVRDRGPGVPPGWRERVFEVFQRGDDRHAATLAGARVGAGVGLAVCRAIARAHGGELKLRPRGHGGSSFELWLPVAEQPAQAASVSEEGPSSQDNTRPRELS